MSADSDLESRESAEPKLPAAGVAASGVAIVRDARTSLGLVELRRRRSLTLGHDVYEILLNGDLMMSSAVHVSEDALAERALGEVLSENLSVLVGGLGLGFTARRVLGDPRVRSMVVVELLAPIIEWHGAGVLPWSNELLADERTTVVHADFFNLLAEPVTPATCFDMILVDIDDGPEHVWAEAHGDFYTQRGLESAVAHLRLGGVLAFWFATRPSEAFLCLLGGVLQGAKIESIRFDDPSLGEPWEHFLVLGHRTE